MDSLLKDSIKSKVRFLLKLWLIASSYGIALGLFLAGCRAVYRVTK